MAAIPTTAIPATLKGKGRQTTRTHLNEMVFSPGLIGTLLSGSGGWEACITASAFECRTGDRQICFRFDAIWQVRCRTGLVWAVIEVRAATGSVVLRGMANGRARRLVTALRRRVTEELMALLVPHRSVLSILRQSLASLLDAPHYLAHFDLVEWGQTSRASYGTSIAAIESLLWRPFFRHHPVSSGLLNQARKLVAALRGDSGFLEKQNEEHIRAEIAECQDFFDSIESLPLTPEQRRASVVMEDRNLLVASAGSGKTSTVVGKVGYALLRELVTSDEVLVVAFNAHAAREIEERVHERLASWMPGSLAIEVRTFHALGLEIIADVERRRPKVCDDGDRAIREIVDELLATDGEMADAWVELNTLYPRDAADPSGFETAEERHAHLRRCGEFRTGRYGFQTLKGEVAESQSECAIANWLFIHGVDYRYEHPPAARPSSGDRRPFVSFFCLPQIDIRLVHLAFDAQGRPPVGLEAEYTGHERWKGRLSSEEQANLVETTFSEFASGELFPRLEEKLTARGCVFKPISVDDILEQVDGIRPRQQDELSELLQTFIKHARSSQKTADDLSAAVETDPRRARARCFGLVAVKVMDRYATRLRETHSVDFEDMILKAARYAHEGRYRHGFRMILVDEFQDISQGRASLLLGLLGQAPECKLFAVGDDWQSIYRFAGSDISLFTGFEQQFGHTAVNYLTQTFRSNQGIAGVAAGFVQRNEAQIRKEVVAQDQTMDGAIVVRRYGRRSEAPRYVEACLEEIAGEAAERGEARTVYILGRYRRLAPKDLEGWQARYQEVLQIDYRTIHGSKGLQADYVILIGLESGGFPSERADDPLLNLVMPELEAHPHAEERRLFYVALTRARHRVYLLGSRRSPSTFLTELVQSRRSGPKVLRIADDLDEPRRPDDPNGQGRKGC